MKLMLIFEPGSTIGRETGYRNKVFLLNLVYFCSIRKGGKK